MSSPLSPEAYLKTRRHAARSQEISPKEAAGELKRARQRTAELEKKLLDAKISEEHWSIVVKNLETTATPAKK